MPKCKDCDCELEYAWYIDDNGNKHGHITKELNISLELLQCPNCNKIYALEMKF